MRFHSFPHSLASLALVFLASSPCVSAQFIYPPPLNGSLSDYTSGAATPTMNFSHGDNMFGGWSTPGNLTSFMIYRCTGSTKPGATLKPLNSDFNSEEGHPQPDKTWAQMPLHSDASDMFGNGMNPGRNPIWFHGDFFANNKTTGDLCWFELYPGTDALYRSDDGDGGLQRVTTVDGESDWYFATEPFKVNPARPNNLTVTWRSSGPKPDLFKNHTEAYMAELFTQFPELKSSSRVSASKTSGSYSIFIQGPGWIGCLALLLALGL